MECIDRVGQQANAYQVKLDATQLEQLANYLALLVKWNKAFNLTGTRNPDELAYRHILDSLTVHQHLNGNQIIDVGTGAGFPGIPLAIANPDRAFSLLDANAKKTRFLNTVRSELKLSNVDVYTQRMEQHNLRYATVVCRALGKLTHILDPLSTLALKGGKIIVMAGNVPEFESVESLQLENIHPLSPPLGNEKRHLIFLRKLY